jgi:RNA polymerase sigma factor (sigma-70 family)
MPEIDRRESLPGLLQSTTEAASEERSAVGVRVFKDCVRDVSPGLRRRLTRVLHFDAETASEVLQDAWLAAWRQIGRFESADNLKRWIYVVAGNRAISVLRRKRRVRTAAWADDLDEEGAVRTPAAPPIDAFDQDDAAMVRAAIARLPDHYRGVATLRYVHGQSLVEIALMLRSSISTVKMRLHRTRTRLRRDLRVRARC